MARRSRPYRITYIRDGSPGSVDFNSKSTRDAKLKELKKNSLYKEIKSVDLQD